MLVHPEVGGGFPQGPVQITTQLSPARKDATKETNDQHHRTVLEQLVASELAIRIPCNEHHCDRGLNGPSAGKCTRDRETEC
jgi:hypothetical protein